MARTETIRIEINGQDSASPAMKQVSSNLGLLEQKLNSVKQAFSSFNDTVNKAFKVTATVMASATGALTATTYFGAKVEKSFQNAYTMFNISEQAFKKLKDEIVELSVPAGKTAKELADALYLVGSAGIDASKAVEVLKTTAIAATAGVTDMSTAFQSAIGQINAFGLTIDDLTRVYAMNFEVVQKGQLNYEELARTFGVISSSANQLGVSLRESLAAYTTLTTVNIDSARAATFTAAAFRDMVAKAEELKKIGVYVFDARGDFRGLKNVVYDLKKALEGLTKEEQNALLQQIGFAAEASQGISNWVTSYEKLDEIMNSIQGNTEALEDAYKKQINSVQFLIDQLRSAIGKLNLAFFEATRSGVVEILQKLIGWIQIIANYIRVNSEQVGRWVWAFMRLGAVLLIGLGALKIFVPILQALIGLMSPAKLLFLSFAIALVKIWNSLGSDKQKSLLEGIGKIFDWLIEKTKVLIDWITDIKSIEDIPAFIAKITAIGAGLGISLSFLGDIPEWLSKGVRAVTVNLIKGAVALWKWFIDAARTITIAAVKGALTLWKWFVDAARTIVIAVAKGAMALWTWFVDALRTITINVIQGVITLWTWFVDALRTITINVIQGVITLWTWFVDALRTITINVIQGVITLWTWFVDALRTITINVIQGVITLWTWFVDALRTITINVIQGVITLWTWFVDALRTITINVIQGAIALWTWFVDMVRTIAINVVQGVITLWAWFINAIRTIAVALIQGAVALWNWFIDGVRTITVGLAKGVANVWPWLLGGAVTIMAAIQLTDKLAEGSISPKEALYSLLLSAAAGLGLAIYGGPAAGFIAFGISLYIIPHFFKEKTTEENIEDIQKKLGDLDKLIKAPVLNNVGFLTVVQKRAQELTEVVSKFMAPEVYETLPDSLKQQIEGLWEWLQEVNGIYTQLELKIIDVQKAIEKLKELSTPGAPIIIDVITGPAPPGGQKGGYFAVGGYTGYGALNDVAGIVHKGEYVVPAWMVKKMPEVIALLEAKRLRGYQEGGGDILGAVMAYLFGKPDAEDKIATLSEDAQVIASFVKSIFDILKTTNPELVKQLQLQYDIGKKEAERTPLQKTLPEDWKDVFELAQRFFNEASGWGEGLANTLNTLAVKLGLKEEVIDKEGNKQYVSTEKGKELAEKLNKTGAAIFGIADYLARGLPEIILGVLGGISAPIIETVGGAFSSAFLGVTDIIKVAFNDLASVMGIDFSVLTASFTNLSKILSPTTVIFQALLNILTPVVNSTLAPLVGILQLVGELLGKILAPAIQFLGIVIEPVAKAFVWLYNNVFVPVGNFILKIFRGLGMLLSSISIFGWKPFESVGNSLANLEDLQTINYADLNQAGSSGTTTTGPTSLGSVTSSGPETINIYITENIIGTEEEFQKIVLRVLEKAGIATGGAAINFIT